MVSPPHRDAGYSNTYTNKHDVSVEASMTGAFVFGPIAALVGFVIGFRQRPKVRG